MGKYEALFDDYTPTPLLKASGPAVGEYESGPLSQQELARSARLAKDPTAEGDVDMQDPRWQRLTGNTPADAAEREQRDEARGFLKFAGTGAAGELATPLISRGIGSVTDRARAIQAARSAARPAPVVSDPAALSPVEAGPAIRFPRRGDFYVPRDGDMGPGLFSTPETSSSLAQTKIMKAPPQMSVVAPEMGRLNAEGAKGGAAAEAEQLEAKFDYRGSHRPPRRGKGAPAHDLTGDDNAVYPDDVYGPRAAQFYGHGGPDVGLDRQTVKIVQGLRGKPDQLVPIYRAVPTSAKPGIDPGDWVTINKDYATAHGERTLGGDYKIESRKVPARDLYTNGDSIHEWGYDPASTPED